MLKIIDSWAHYLRFTFGVEPTLLIRRSHHSEYRAHYLERIRASGSTSGELLLLILMFSESTSHQQRTGAVLTIAK